MVYLSLSAFYFLYEPICGFIVDYLYLIFFSPWFICVKISLEFCLGTIDIWTVSASSVISKEISITIFYKNAEN